MRWTLRPNKILPQSVGSALLALLAVGCAVSDTERVRRAVLTHFERCVSYETAEAVKGFGGAEILLRLDREGNVREAFILDRERIEATEGLAEHTESARNSLLGKNCSPIDLPADLYEELWRDLLISIG